MENQRQRPGELKIPVVQMTPMIHFQYKEPGATLRATEVKPKLDRYLLHAAFHDDPEQYKNYLVAKDKNNTATVLALDYRLVISANPEDFERPIQLASPPTSRNYTGSIWDKSNAVATMLKPDKTLTLIFRTQYPALIDHIQKWIHSFFAGENFGRRQSKGFGSFLTEITAGDFEKYHNALKQHLQTIWAKRDLKVHYFTSPSDWKQVLNDIRDMHRVLKSGDGLSGNNNRIPSFLMQTYASSHYKLKNFDNEKKLMITRIVQNVRPIDLNASSESSTNPNSYQPHGRFLRSMLGLPGFLEFRKILINGYPYTVRIRINNREIQRFRSPITYKPVMINNEWHCYLILVPIPMEMYGKTFVFSSNGRNVIAEKYPDPNNPETLLRSPNLPPDNLPYLSIKIPTPKDTEFDLLDVLDKFCSKDQVIRTDNTKRNFYHVAINEEAPQHE